MNKKLRETAKLFILAIIIFAPNIVYAQLDNPLGETDIRIIIGRVVSGMLGNAGAVSLLMFVYGGMLWLTSGGNPERINIVYCKLESPLFLIFTISGYTYFVPS